MAVDHYGKGRIAYYCDMTTLKQLMKDFPELVRYLGKRPEPKVLVFGYQFLCQPLNSLPGFKYAGTSLPREYDGNASALARDFDIVIFGPGFLSGWKASWGEALRDFVRTKGGGLVLVGDYYGGCSGFSDLDFEALNSIANDARARFNKVSLGVGKSRLAQVVRMGRSGVELVLRENRHERRSGSCNRFSVERDRSWRVAATFGG